MDQDPDLIDHGEAVDPAALAFEALRREVTVLTAAVSALAAHQGSIPDYSESLGQIAGDLARTAKGVGQLAASPALALTPREVAQQIAWAGTEGRRQDHEALQAAQAGLERAAGDLRDWIACARLASQKNLRLVQVGLAGLVVGVVLGALVPGAIANRAPERWAWPEKMAAALLHRDLWSAGERMLAVADPVRWRAMQGAQTAVSHPPSPAPEVRSKPRHRPTTLIQACGCRPIGTGSLPGDMAICSYIVLSEATMLTHKIDGALDALLACMMRLPALRDCYRPGTPERTALDDLMASLQQTDAVLFSGGGASSARGPADLQAGRDHRT